MSTTTFLQLPDADLPLAGDEVLALVQSGDSKKVSVSDLVSGSATSFGDGWNWTTDPNTLNFSFPTIMGDWMTVTDNGSGEGVVTLQASGISIVANTGDGVTLSMGVGPGASISLNEVGDADISVANDITLESGRNIALTVTGTFKFNGFEVGYKNIPQNSQSGSYTTVLADAGKHIYHPAAGGAGDTYTIAANASVAYDIGTAISFINRDPSNSVAIAITSDTLFLAGTGTTGTRTLSSFGMATAVKITATEWMISGTGLT